MRTRAQLLARGGRQHALEGTLAHAAASGRHIVEELIRFGEGDDPPDDAEALAARANKDLSLEAGDLRALFALHGAGEISRDAAARALSTLDALARAADQANARARS
jgi:hypothetical protein